MSVKSVSQNPRAWLALTFSILLAACAPAVEKREFAPVKQAFETRTSDPVLDLDSGGRSTSIDISRLAWDGDDVSSAEILRAAEGLFRLSRRFDKTGLEQAGERLTQAFYGGVGTTSIATFENTPFVSAAVGETQEEIADRLDDVRKMLVNERVVIGQILDASVAQYPWPRGHRSVTDLLGHAERYLAWWISRMETIGVDPRILREIRDVTQVEFAKNSKRLKNLFQRLANARTMTAAIVELKFVLKELEVGMTPEILAELRRGETIGHELDHMSSAQHALSLIIDFWNLLTPEEQKARFKAMNSDLYDYLSERSPDELSCLKQDNCIHPIVIFHKQVKIFPALREFGIDKLRAEMDAAAREYILREVETRATAFLPEVPGLIRAEIEKEFVIYLQKVNSIRKDIKGFIRKITSRWARERMNRDGLTLLGVEAARVSVRYDSRINNRIDNGIERGIQIRGGKKFVTGAEVLGSSLALAAERLELKPGVADANAPTNLRLAVTQLNKMLALGGFKTANRKQYASYAVALDPEAPPNSHVYLRDFLGSPFSYAAPEKFQVKGAFDIVLPPFNERLASVRAQSELLRGLSGMIRYLRDWEQSGFDQGLAKVKVADLLEDVPSDGITEALFPKDMMFALAVGNAAVVLQNMAKRLTPVFLMDLNDQANWASEFDLTKGNSSTMAALVDIKGGVRQELVRTEDVARYALAIIDFLDAIEGIEKTKAPPLLERDPQGRQAVEHLLASKNDLRLLLVGISNFLASQMQSVSGGFKAEFDKTKRQSIGGHRLIDQALAIRVMVRTSKMFNVRAYASIALESYFFMNQTLWNPQMRFYKKDDSAGGPPSPDEVLSVLEGIEDLVPSMNSKSRDQWKKISQPWLSALEAI